MGSNPVEALKFFSGLNLQLLKIAIITAMVKSLFHLCSRSSHHLYITSSLFNFTLVSNSHPISPGITHNNFHIHFHRNRITVLLVLFHMVFHIQFCETAEQISHAFQMVISHGVCKKKTMCVKIFTWFSHEFHILYLYTGLLA